MAQKKLKENLEQSAFKVAYKGVCPRCGIGKLFQSLLKPMNICSHCNLDMSFAEEGDGPAVFAIFILGFLIVGLALYVEYTFRPPFWVHIILWIPVTSMLGIFALKFLKGLMIYTQYKTGASEGRWDR